MLSTKRAIFQKSSKWCDDKFNKNAITDKDKTDLSNSNDINGTSNKQQGSKYGTKMKKYNPDKNKFWRWDESCHQK